MVELKAASMAGWTVLMKVECWGSEWVELWVDSRGTRSVESKAGMKAEKSVASSVTPTADQLDDLWGYWRVDSLAAVLGVRAPLLADWKVVN